MKTLQIFQEASDAELSTDEEEEKKEDDKIEDDGKEGNKEGSKGHRKKLIEIDLKMVKEWNDLLIVSVHIVTDTTSTSNSMLFMQF